MNSEQVLAAGGIAVHAAPGSDPIDAIAFVHPAITGRVVVRLVPQNLDSGVAREMGLAGFTERTRQVGVGHQRRRAPGFPAWALLHDPKNARYAMEVMKGFAAAKKRIATKPGHARDAFSELATQLGRAAPHFLPSFWEEAGRAFVAGGAIAMAASSFEKARLAEREHGLQVDEDARADSFLEFAIAGALSVKTLLAWPAELKKTHGADAAFTRLYELALRRTLGGRAPWASLPRDLKDAARAAKRDPATEEARFVRAVLGCVAMKRAPIGFWKEVAPSVGSLAGDPGVWRDLARIFPDVGGEADITLWVALLDGWGVTARLAAEGIEGGLATWFGKALQLWDDAPTALIALAQRLAPRLAQEGLAVPVLGDDVWRVTSLDAWELLLASGVALEPRALGPDEEHGQFALDSWAESGGTHADPVHLAAHPTLGPILRDSVLNTLDEDAFQRIAPGMSAFREVRRVHLVETLARLSTGGLPDFAEALDEVEGKIPASTLQEFEREAAPAAAATVTGALARALSGGVLDELGWPAFDAAIAELLGPAGGSVEVEVHTMAPWAVLTDGRRAIVVGPGGREAAFDLKLPKGREVQAFRWVGGQLLVAWRDPSDYSKRQGYWSGKPKEIVAIEWGHGEDEALTPARGSGVLGGRRALRAGDTAVDNEPVFSDAEGVWSAHGRELCAVDPVTGAVGPPDVPAFLADRDGVALDLSGSVYVQGVAGSDSPLGQVAGQHGWAIFDLGELDPAAREAWISRHSPRAVRVGVDPKCAGIHLDGRSVLCDTTPRGLLAWPASDAARVLVDEGWRSRKLVGADGTWLANIDDDALPFRAGSPHGLPGPLWHHLRPRDLAGSAALRGVDDTAASDLLALADGLEGDDVLQALAVRVKGALPITDDALARGVAGVIQYAAALNERLAAWRAPSSAAAPVEGVRDELVRAALSGLTARWGDDDLSVIAAIRSTSAFLAGGPGPLASSEVEWRDWLGCPLGLAFVLLSPCTSEDERATIREVLGALAQGAEGPLAALSNPALRRVHVRADRTCGWLKWVDNYGDKELAETWTWVSAEDPAFRAACFAIDTEDDGVTVDLLLVSPGGALPPGAGLLKELPVQADGAKIRQWLGAAPLELAGDAVYDAICEPSGLGRAEAAWAWAGLRELHGWASDPLGKVNRERLGVKVQELKAVRGALRSTSTLQRCQVFHAAMLGEGLDDLPARLGRAWAATFGKRARVDEAVLAKARVDFPGGDGPEAIVALAGLGTEAQYQVDADWKIDGDGDVARLGDAEATVFEPDALVRGAGTVLWVYANTPAGDPIRALLPALHAALRTRAANPALLIPVASGSEKPMLGWYKRFDGAAFTPADVDPDVAEKDRPTGKRREGLYAVSNGEQVGVAVRPSELTLSAREEVTRLVALDDNWCDTEPWSALTLLGTDGVEAIVRDVAASTAPAGSWAQDPRVSSPGVVTGLAEKLGLDPEAAVLYLQLLALHNPTKANVLVWNGWKPAVYARAVGLLVGKGLVVQAKRARAGRDHFLPGGWLDRKSGSLPMEEWKLRWYTLGKSKDPPLGSILPLQPLRAIFEDALARVLSGDLPRYEKPR